MSVIGIGWQKSGRRAIDTVRGGRARWVWLSGVVVAVLAVGAVAYTGYGITTETAAPAARPAAKVERMPFVSTVSARGAVAADREADLAFGTAGRVSELRVRVGQTVEAGEVLAVLSMDDLEAQVGLAQADLRAAELRLQQIKDIATGEEVEAAKAALRAAEARVAELTAGARGGAIQTAELAVAAAEARLASATARREELEAGVSPAARAEADQVVTVAQSRLAQAQADLAALQAGSSPAAVEAARLDVSRVRQTLLAEQLQRDAVCGRANDGECASANARVAGAELAVRQAELRAQVLTAGPSAEVLAAAKSAVESARRGVESAVARREAIVAGPARSEILAARSDEQAARAELSAARARLAELREGALASEIASAEASKVSAAAALAALTSQRAGELALAEEEVRKAEMAVRRAELARDAATIKAPFAGVVTAIHANLGEQVTESTPAITIVDPKAVRVDASVVEADVTKVQVGQSVNVTLDALSGKSFSGRVTAVSSDSTLQRGTPSYLVSVEIDPGDVHLTAGMSAVLSIITEQRDGVLMVPNRALRRQGDSQFVEVLVGGEPAQRPVQTGASTGQHTEVLAGLEEGEEVLLPR